MKRRHEGYNLLKWQVAWFGPAHGEKANRATRQCSWCSYGQAANENKHCMAMPLSADSCEAGNGTTHTHTHSAISMQSTCEVNITGVVSSAVRMQSRMDTHLMGAATDSSRRYPISLILLDSRLPSHQMSKHRSTGHYHKAQ